MTTYRLLAGDVRETLATLPEASVQCCVTSPPYWGLRDYGVAGQLGLEPAPDCLGWATGAPCGECYVCHMVQVFREVRRVLRPDGTVFLNLGDSYFSDGQRQTGRNDGDRETPGGRGGSFRGGMRTTLSADARRAKTYGTSGKAPASSQERGCLCESLCDECLRAYRIGKSHSGSPLAPMLTALPSVSSLAHTVSPTGHLPTSDLSQVAGRNVDAIQDQPPAQGRAVEPLPASQASTPDLSSRQPPASSHPSGTPSVCRLCSRSFLRVSQGCECKTASPSASRSTSPDAQASPEFPESIDDTVGTGDSSDDRTSGKASDLTYVDFTTERHHLKHKDLVGIPWRVAFALQADGWYLRSDIIWSKPNPMPESVTDRPTKAHEYLFLLTKNAKYYYDAAAIAEASVGEQPISRMRLHNGLKAAKLQSLAKSTLGTPADDVRNKRTVWTVATQPYSGAHFATFPEALIEPCILAGSREGDTVLDPFNGSGTTGAVSVRHRRHYIGCELNPEYIALARERIGAVAPLFAIEQDARTRAMEGR